MAMFVYPETSIKILLYPLWAWKVKNYLKNILNKDHQHIGIQFRIRDLSKKDASKAPKAEIKKKKFKRKICVISLNEDDSQIKKKKDDLNKNMNCSVQYLVDDLCYKKNEILGWWSLL